MAKAVLPFCAASVLLHALPLALSLERGSLRDLPATPSELLLLPLAPEPSGKREATAARATESLAAAAPAAPAPLRAPRERFERAPGPSPSAPSVAARSVAVTAAPSAVAPTSEQSVVAAPAADPPGEETSVAVAAAASGAAAASSQWAEAPRVASGGSAAPAPSARTSGERTPGSAAEDPVAARARYLRALRQRVLERREYPYPAQRAGLQGTVCLRLSVDAAGRLSELRATCGPSPPPLLEAALRAVRAAEPFGPLPSGLGNQLTLDLPVVFRLDAP